LKALRFALLALSRDWRSGELMVLLAALLVAVTALTGVGFFTDRVGRAVEQQAAEVIAADLRLQASQAPSDEYIARARSKGLATARTLTFPTVVFYGEESSLASIRAVGEGYPLRGKVKIADAPFAPGRETAGIPARGEVWLDSRLLARLAAEVGNDVNIGASTFRVSKVLDYRPDQGSAFVDLAPSLLMNLEDMPATQLIQPGSRATYAILFAGESAAVRAFKAGWGGVVWKTLGEDPPVVNVNGPRYGAVHSADRRLIGFNNIELISDRPLDINLREIKQLKRNWPDRAMVVSLMVPCEEAAWKRILPLVEETGADGIELNFGCPHGMSERGMGSAVGQVPEYVEMVARWCKANTRMPVIVKLTPNITDIRHPARAANTGGADAVSLINTVNSIVSVDLDRMAPNPHTDGKGTHGGYCGPAVKPMALNMVAEIARDPATRGLPISGIGGVTTWRDAAEFMALGASNVQVCTAAMTYGFRIIEELTSGLNSWMEEKGYQRVADMVGAAIPNVTDWRYLNLNYVVKARIDQDLCIQCGRCHIVCEDTSHQAITATKDGKRHFEVIDAECVGCNLCVSVCPVEDCITMEALTEGVDPRTGRPIDPSYANWTTHPNNPQAAE